MLQNAGFHVLWLNISLSVCVYQTHLHTHYLYLFICQWILRLFSCLGYCEKCYNEHGGNKYSWREWFHFFWTVGFWIVPSRSGIAGLYDTFIFSFFRNPSPYCFPQWLYQLHSYQQSTRVLFAPQPCQHLSVFLITAFLTYVKWLWFGLALSWYQWCSTYFHTSVGHLYVCFG